MGLSKSLLSYKDVQDLCDRAMQAERGIKVKPGGSMSPQTLRDRIYHFRKMQRAENAKIYPPGEPMHGVCPYDELMFEVTEDSLTILNTNGKNERYTIEEV